MYTSTCISVYRVAWVTWEQPFTNFEFHFLDNIYVMWLLARHQCYQRLLLLLPVCRWRLLTTFSQTAPGQASSALSCWTACGELAARTTQSPCSRDSFLTSTLIDCAFISITPPTCVDCSRECSQSGSTRAWGCNTLRYISSTTPYCSVGEPNTVCITP